MALKVRYQLMSADEMRQTLEAMTSEILTANPDRPVILLGIERRGGPLAHRLSEIMEARGTATALGTLDINLYRDDLQERAQPLVRPTQMPFRIDGKKIVLVDDVLFTGRTIRAALDALMDFGRPGQVQLAILVDRGHQELPIRADYVGRTVSTDWDEVVKVRLMEVDSVDEVVLSKRVLGLPILLHDEGETGHGDDS